VSNEQQGLIEAVPGERWGGNSRRQYKSLRMCKSQNATEDCNAKYTAEFIGDAFDGAGHAGFIFWRVDQRLNGLRTDVRNPPVVTW